MLGGIVQIKYAKTRKFGSLMMGFFFDGLGVWWIIKVLKVSAVAEKWIFIAALVCGALGLLSDALNIGGTSQRSDTR